MKIIMPIETAAWLVKYTKLTDKQIAQFCQIELRNIMDLRAGRLQLNPVDPVNETQQLSYKEIQLSTQDPLRPLKNIMADLLTDKDLMVKEKAYVPTKLRRQKKHITLVVLKLYPNISDKEIAQLVSMSIKTIKEYKNNIEELTKNINVDEDLNTYFDLNPFWKNIKIKYNID